MLFYALVIIIAPFAAALTTACLSTPNQKLAGILAILPPLIATILGTILWREVALSEPIIIPIQWIPAIGLNANLRLDRLGCFFVILIGSIGLAIVQYSRHYFKASPPKNYWPLLLAFMGSMLGLILSDSLVLLYAFWEATTVSSALLIGLDTKSPLARRGAIQAFLVTGLGGLSLLAGIILIGMIGGTFNLSELANRSQDIISNPVHTVALFLIAIGAFTKSAQWPFHFWLPGAMSAPAPISAYLHSATMVNAGVFLLGRFVPILGDSELWRPLLSTVGITTFLIGSWLAFRAFDLKQLLAYSTVAYLGILTSLYAYAPETGSKGELLHFANHALYKSSLFLMLGWFEKIAGTRNISTLDDQLWFPRLPFGAILFCTAALAMSGGPFLLGFESKKLFFESVVGSARLPIVGIAVFIASVLTVATALKLSVSTFWGTKQPPMPSVPPSAWLIALPTALLVPQLIGGLLPGDLFTDIFGPAAQWPGGFAFWSELDLTTAIKLSILGFGIVLYLVWRHIARLPDIQKMDVIASHIANKTLRFSTWTGQVLQAGGHPRYLAVTFGLTAFLAVSVMIGSNASFQWQNNQFFTLDSTMALMPAALVTIGSLLALFLKARTSKLVALALSGYGLALFYVIYRAPDLALTQVLAETVSLILLLLAFMGLPKLVQDERHQWQRVIHAAVATSVGLVVAGVTFLAGQITPNERAGAIHASMALPEGGGRNIVNVILTDFRAGDTLIEIAVLVVSALGVIALLHQRRLR